jgi:hypothetical protein
VSNSATGGLVAVFPFSSPGGDVVDPFIAEISKELIG